jgi:hypothetical protein
MKSTGRWTAMVMTLALAACAGPAGSPPTAPLSATAASSTRNVPKSMVIGSFNPARGGIESLKSPDVAGLNAAIASMFHPKFRYTGKLTPKFLHGVNVMVIGVAAAVSGEIKPLSAKEQSALLNFAKRGGTVVVFADNSDFQKADDSVLKPFGLASSGKLDGAQTATWVGSVSQNPLANGPAGSALQLDTYYPGWFSVLGSALDLADLPGSGAPAAAYLQRGALGAQSGAVVFLSDSSLMLDGTRTENDQIAILNAIAL